MADNNNKVITLDLFRQAMRETLDRVSQRTVRNGDESFRSVTIGDSGYTISVTDSKLSVINSETDVVLKFPEPNSDRETEYTLAVCEDNNQELHMDKLCNEWYWFELPGTHHAHDESYGGKILTTYNRALEVAEQVTTEDSNDVTIYPGLYHVVTGSSVKFSAYRGGAFVYQSGVSVTFIDWAIPADAESVSVEWPVGTVWQDREPDWYSYRGSRVIILILNGMNIVLASTNASSGGGSQHTPAVVVEQGPLEDAIAYGLQVGNKTRQFQWLLEFEDNGSKVVKPIWHIGNGSFVDCLGYKLSGEQPEEE